MEQGPLDDTPDIREALRMSDNEILQRSLFEEREQPGPDYSQDRVFVGWEKTGPGELGRPQFMKHGKKTTALIVGGRGSGKTWLIRAISGNLYKSGCRVVFLNDIKGDMQSNNHRGGIQQHKLNQSAGLRQGVEPQPLPTKMYTPYMFRNLYPNNKTPRWSEHIQFRLTDLEADDITDILSDGDQSSPQHLFAEEVGYRVEEGDITQIGDVGNRKLKYENCQHAQDNSLLYALYDHDDIEASSKKVLFRKIKRLKTLDAFGTDIKDRFDEDGFHEFIDRLDGSGDFDHDEIINLKDDDDYEFGDHQMVALNMQHYNQMKNNDLAQLYPSLILKQIIDAQQEERLNTSIPTDIFIDEAHEILPEDADPKIKERAKRVIDVYRHLGNRVFIATQNPEDIDEKLFHQCNQWFIPGTAVKEIRKPVLEAADFWEFSDTQKRTWKKRFDRMQQYEWMWLNSDTGNHKVIVPPAPMTKHE